MVMFAIERDTWIPRVGDKIWNSGEKRWHVDVVKVDLEKRVCYYLFGEDYIKIYKPPPGHLDSNNPFIDFHGMTCERGPRTYKQIFMDSLS